MKKSHGFTLIELMVGVSIGAILLALAAPSFTDLIRRSRLNNSANELLSAANYARSEALKRGQAVSICHTVAPANLNPSCGGSGSSWATGWLVFVDGGAPGVLDGADSVLRASAAIDSGAAFNVVPVASYSNFFGFRPSGRPLSGSGIGNGTIFICNGEYRRSLTVSVSGRITLESLPNSSTCNFNG